MSKTVAVLFGGRSNEREISVITGMLAVNLLRSTDWRVIPVWLPPEGGMATGDYKSPADFKKDAKIKHIPVRFEKNALVQVKRGKKLAEVNCALNCCHGGMGEDGTLSALLAWHGIPFASPQMPLSAVFMDKILTKIAARGLEIPVIRSFAIYEEEWRTSRDTVLAKAERFSYPIVLKPAKLGSSIGVKVVQNAAELDKALELAFRLDGAVLAEAYLEGKRDINCAAYRRGGEVLLSPLEEVFSDEKILTFSDKYERGGGRTSQLPALLPEEVAESIRTYTKRIYEAFGVVGVVRADFLVVGDEVYFNELNTVPGSLSCYLFGKTLTEQRNFLVSLVSEATAPKEKELISSGILENNLFSGKRRK